MNQSRIKDYKIVSEHEVSQIKKTVNAMIADKWVPSGNLTINTPVINDGVAALYSQVMINNAG